MVELCLATRNMASSEEGSTHTRTIQKRAKKTQDQACQFDASLLEGERYCYFFFAYTLSVFLGRWTQCLCDVTSVTQSIKYFLLFAFFRGNWNLWSLQPNFWVRKVGLDWYCFMSDSKDLGLRDCELFFAPQRVVLCRRNLSVPVPRGLAISNSLGSLFSDVFFLDFILKHLAGWVKCCIIFFSPRISPVIPRTASRVWSLEIFQKQETVNPWNSKGISVTVCVHLGLFLGFILCTAFRGIVLNWGKRNLPFKKFLLSKRVDFGDRY